MNHACSKCSQTPEIHIKHQYVYIGLLSNHIIEKIESYLDSLAYDYEHKASYFIVKIKSLETLVLDMISKHILSTVEQKDVYLLPRDSKSDPNFSTAIQARNLIYYHTLFTNKDIVEVLEKEHIKTFFQPIVHNQTQTVYGHEALSRAYTGENKNINTERLFKISKQLDLMYNLDRQCRIASIENANKQEGFTGKLFINFIPTVIYDPEVCLKTTHEAISKTSIRPCDVVFEVVESEFVDDYNHLADILSHYKKMGYETALDDVGSGYATLNKYDILKTDYIKIDMEIIRNIHLSESNQAYLKTVLDLKKRTGVKIIAEGVETLEEYEYLKNTQVDFLQGYYFAKPAETIKKTHE